MKKQNENVSVNEVKSITPPHQQLIGKTIAFEKVGRETCSLFGCNETNRVINKGHVNKIKKAFVKSIDVMPPIKVNKVTNNIIDGQHRLAAFVKLVDDGVLDKDAKIWVQYVEISIENEKYAIIASNINSKNWSEKDFVNHFIQDNNESYIKLDAWCRQHPLMMNGKNPNYRYGYACVKGENGCGKLKNSDIEITDRDLIIGDNVYNEIKAIFDILKIDKIGHWIESFIPLWYAKRTILTPKVWQKGLKLKLNDYIDRIHKSKKSKADWENIFNEIQIKAMSKKIK